MGDSTVRVRRMRERRKLDNLFENLEDHIVVHNTKQPDGTWTLRVDVSLTPDEWDEIDDRAAAQDTTQDVIMQEMVQRAIQKANPGKYIDRPRRVR